MNTAATFNLEPALKRIRRDARLAIDVLCAHIRQPSLSVDGTGMDLAAEQVATLTRACGFGVRMLASKGYPAVYGERRAGPDCPTILLYGHYDVQPPGTLDDWTSPPFDPEERDGRIYGRGSSDNKGQHIANLYGLKALFDTCPDLSINVKILIEGEEEIASPNLGAILRDNRELLAADLAVISDGPMHVSGRPTVVCGSRGLIYLDVSLRTANHDLHSGSWGGVVDSAASLLARALSTLHAPDGSIAVPHFQDRVREPTETERNVAQLLPIDGAALVTSVGAAHPTGPADRTVADRLQFHPNINIAGFSSGYSGPGMKTVIPAVAAAKVDVRLVPDQVPDQIVSLLTSWLQRSHPDISVSVVGTTHPHRTPIDDPWVAAVARGVELACGEPPVLVPSLGGTVPLAAFSDALGCAVLMLPYANADQNNHGPDENIAIASFIRGMQTIAGVVTACAASQP